MSEKLKPCPFCGGEAQERGHKGVGTAIQCTVCGANSGIRQRSRKESAEAWNRRYAPIDYPERCNNCTHKGDKAWDERCGQQGRFTPCKMFDRPQSNRQSYSAG
jgi:Lar family restriction alleviation protein